MSYVKEIRGGCPGGNILHPLIIIFAEFRESSSCLRYNTLLPSEKINDDDDDDDDDVEDEDNDGDAVIAYYIESE